MRVICFLILLVLVVGMVIFALQNDDRVTIRFLEWNVAYPLSLVAGAVYLIGMITGWTFLGLLRRSVYHVTERVETRG